MQHFGKSCCVAALNGSKLNYNDNILLNASSPHRRRLQPPYPPGLILRVPQLDFVTAAQMGLHGFEDSILLKWAAREDRTILTHDVRTMTHYARQLITENEAMAGVVVVPQRLQIGRAIADLELLVECRSQNEMRDRIEYLPL